MPETWIHREGSTPHYQSVIYAEDGSTIAICYNDERGARARRIVQAVNAHDDLVAALDRAKGHLIVSGTRQSDAKEALAQVLAALAKARAE